MLVLTRKVNQQIVIGDKITITVLEVRGNLVKLGIEAPDNVGVHRFEVWTRIQAEVPDEESGGHQQPGDAA